MSLKNIVGGFNFKNSFFSAEAEVIKLSPDIMYDIMIGYQDNGVYGEEVKECETLDLLTD